MMHDDDKINNNNNSDSVEQNKGKSEMDTFTISDDDDEQYLDNVVNLDELVGEENDGLITNGMKDIPDDQQVDFMTKPLNDVDVMTEALQLLKNEGNVQDSKNNDIQNNVSFDDTSIDDIALNDDDDHTTNNKRPDQSQASREEGEEPMIPLHQFENALKLIQDLEQQVDNLERMKHQLQYENEQLRQETSQQKTLITAYEKKLSEFPKLMETTLMEQTAVAEKHAKGLAKMSFWNEYMTKQEELRLEEMKAKQGRRNNTATTESLKQSDFLHSVVERQQEGHQRSSFLQKFKLPQIKRNSKDSNKNGQQQQHGHSNSTTNNGNRSSSITSSTSNNNNNNIGRTKSEDIQDDETAAMFEADEGKRPPSKNDTVLNLLA